jgi:hypothetical protein
MERKTGMTPTELSTMIETSIRILLTDLTVTTLLRETSDALRTSRIKGHLCEIGRKHFHVSASGCDANDREWLYDMVWAEMSNGLFVHQAMVMECENKIFVALAGKVDGDFQKLVQARADVRVWICPVPNRDKALEHIESCKQQIAAFSGTVSGDHYLLVLLIYLGNDFEIKAFRSP